jgi:hypothetical protein
MKTINRDINGPPFFFDIAGIISHNKEQRPICRSIFDHMQLVKPIFTSTRYLKQEELDILERGRMPPFLIRRKLVNTVSCLRNAWLRNDISRDFELNNTRLFKGRV